MSLGKLTSLAFGGALMLSDVAKAGMISFPVLDSTY